ncbi:MAG: DUF1905 domain-containing protein [Gemmataceae bacterium]
MPKARFTAPILAGHKQAAVEVPFDPGERWGLAPVPIRPGRRGFKVQGALAGAPFQSAIVPRSKRFWLLLEDAHLKAAGVAVGASVTVVLEPAAA